MLSTGYVCMLPHLGHWTGAMLAQAYHSAATPSKCSPQLSHLKFVVPQTILFDIYIYTMYENDIDKFLDKDNKRKETTQ